ncbi:hypothetical protein FBR02_08400 [Anaerolineae bacterium CFX9]|nr:hypothetical protein [Anaerolineae bacterium CFX9]
MRARLWRHVTPFILTFVTIVLPFTAMAQEDRALVPGEPVTGTLDAANIIQVYTYLAAADETFSVTATNTIGVPLAVAITDAGGNLLAQSVDSEPAGETVTEAVSVDEAGLIYITVFKAGGVASVAVVGFTLVIDLIESGTQTPSPTPEPTFDAAVTIPAEVTPQPAAGPGQLLTTSGLSVTLNWNTSDDLDLEVRDPVGGSLYWRTPSVNSGGTLSPNVNQGCAVATSPATETAAWSSGGIPTGSYEVIVYYQQACSGDTPVDFTIQVTVDGRLLAPLTGTVRSGDVFVSAFVVNADGTAAFTGQSGLADEQILPAPASQILASAVPIDIGETVFGTITNQNTYAAYTFQANANDLVTVALQATSGSLDTYVAILDSAGNIIRANDDLAEGFTDSQIDNALMPSAGTYTIVATRYAKAIGGTEGDFVLSVVSQPSDLPAEFLNLPPGSIEVRLLWRTNADLQLLVRDPNGDAIYDDIPQVRSGGELAAQGNVNCRVSEGAPFSYIYWPTTITPRPGSYEVEVWYQNECGDTTPVSFNLFINVNGRQVFSDVAQPLPNERYLTSFTILPDGTVQPSAAGIIRGIETLDYASELENARLLVPGEPALDAITPDNKFDVYFFQGLAGQVVNIAMNNTSGTLDPTLYLIGPLGNLVAENDDAVAGENTNSLIADFTLPQDGQYIIIATHYGALYGGTTGTYQLTLTQRN